MPLSSKELMAQFLEYEEERHRDPEKHRGWKTGIADLDRILGGLHRGWYFVVAGKRKAGKTAFLTTLTRELGFQGVSFLRVSLEEGNMQIAERQVSNVAGIDRSLFRDVLLTPEDWGRVYQAAEAIGGFGGYWDSGLVTVAKIGKVARECKVDVVLVDYVQLMEEAGYGSSRTMEVGSISRGLKALTQGDPPLTVVAAAQLNDEGEYLWSRDLGRDADVGIKLGRKLDPYGQVIEDRLVCEIADSRHSEMAEFDIMFNGARSLVGSLQVVDINRLVEERIGSRRKDNG